MLKLQVDWAGDERPDAKPFEGVTVKLVQEHGPGAGWPVYEVRAEGRSGAEAGPRLWAWLVEVYGSSEDEASELASDAEWV